MHSNYFCLGFTFLADKQIFELFGEHRVFDRKSQISGISPNLYSPDFQKKKRFCDKCIFKTRVKVIVHPVGPPTQILVTMNFRGACLGKREIDEIFALNARLNDQHICARNLKILLLWEC